MKYTSKTEKVYIQSMGKAYRITAIFDNDREANNHMEKPGNSEAVIACYGGLVFLADKYSGGNAIAHS